MIGWRHRAMLRVASWIVPGRQRGEWLKEWTAELCYALASGFDATAFCLGSFHDAAWLLGQQLRAQAADLTHLRGPAHCLSVLGGLAAFTLAVAMALPRLQDPLWTRPVLSRVILIVASLIILPSATSIHFQVEIGTRRLRNWMFLAAKLVLLVTIVCASMYDLSHLLSRSGLEPHASLLGYVLALNWALSDQRRRCPDCLRLLTDPVRIGQPSGTLLDWYGTEFVCAKGHGVLYVPELLESSYCRSHWVTLDASWQELFADSPTSR